MRLRETIFVAVPAVVALFASAVHVINSQCRVTREADGAAARVFASAPGGTGGPSHGVTNIPAGVRTKNISARITAQRVVVRSGEELPVTRAAGPAAPVPQAAHEKTGPAGVETVAVNPSPGIAAAMNASPFEEPAAPLPFRGLRSGGGYVRFRENDPQWRARHRVAIFHEELRARGGALREKQVEPLVELFDRFDGANAVGGKEDTAIPVMPARSEQAKVLEEDVTALASAYDKIVEDAARILDQGQMDALERFLEADLMRREADRAWLLQFLQGLQRIEGTSITLRVGEVMPGAFGLPVGGVDVRVDGRPMEAESPPFFRQ